MNDKLLIDRTLLEQALDALLHRTGGSDQVQRIDAAITDLCAALATPAPHGCHVDVEDGIEPDGCVLDEGKPEKCIYAKRLHREGKDKTACEYWQPIEVKK